MASPAADPDCPVRSYMDSPDIQWRHQKPDFTLVNKRYLAGRSKNHKLDSLEKLVENLVKTWEMESSHKVDKKDWQTVDPACFRLRVNGGPPFSLDDNIREGNYNLLLDACPLYKTGLSGDESHRMFRNAFSVGFAWELLEILAGPPKVVFTWRHWTEWSGPYGDTPPTGEKVELTGCAIVTVNDALKIQEIDVYYDPCPMLHTLTKDRG